MTCPLELDDLGSRFSRFFVCWQTQRVSFLPVRHTDCLNYNLCAIDQASLGRPQDQRTGARQLNTLVSERVIWELLKILYL